MGKPTLPRILVYQEPGLEFAFLRFCLLLWKGGKRRCSGDLFVFSLIDKGARLSLGYLIDGRLFRGLSLHLQKSGLLHHLNRVIETSEMLVKYA